MRSKTKRANNLKTVHGQPSWRLASNQVEAFATQMGGHLGPVTFDRGGRRIRPYSVAPWAEEPDKSRLLPIIKALRGDFFCLPFGGNATPFGREKHPVHGETANARWHFESLENKDGRRCLHLSLKTRVRPGRVDKKIFLLDGQNAVYSQHLLSEISGPMSLGHHAMLKFPDAPSSGVLSTSPFVCGQVFPQVFESPEKGGYSFLKPGAQFTSLESVPAATGETADLTRYPARRGFEDLLMLVSDSNVPFAWTAVVFAQQRFAWFALKNPRILRETVIWISNGGRHYPPWNGRHVNVLGLEEVTSYFHVGLAESAASNPISDKGFPTCLVLAPQKPLLVPYIMGVVAIPADFDRVISIQAADGNRAITLQSANAKQAAAPVNLDFLDGRQEW
jgi:hypothetical protein